MRDRLFVDKSNILRESAGKVDQLSISGVLAEYGTRVMLALDRGENVFIITETEKESLSDRVGS